MFSEKLTNKQTDKVTTNKTRWHKDTLKVLFRVNLEELLRW